jgi:hypothetical protein
LLVRGTLVDPLRLLSDVDKPALVGHSFGGATVLEKARQSSKEAEQPWLLIMALDPWVEPLVEDDRPPNVTPTCEFSSSCARRFA